VQDAALSPNGRALELLARDLIGRQPGERLPTVAQYQERLGIGSGTVQARLRMLSGIGAIRLRAHGHRGTVLVERDLSELWSLSRMSPIRGVLPLPDGFEPVTLAAVLRQQCESLKVPLELLYLHGSARRINMVREHQAHFAVASRPAALQATAIDPDAWSMLEFGPETYHRNDAMVVLLRPHLGADDRISTIGFDSRSYDHSVLTHAEFPEQLGYHYADHPHSRLPSVLAEGRIDAAVWHRATLAIPLSAVGIVVRPLHQPEAIALAHAMGHAVLMTLTASREVLAVLKSIDLSGTRTLQDEIERSESLPLY
jgi:hypothetical protein